MCVLLLYEMAKQKENKQTKKKHNTNMPPLAKLPKMELVTSEKGPNVIHRQLVCKFRWGLQE